MTKLTKSQEAAMKKHKVHHSAKHMKDMRNEMIAGKSFKQAHTIAKKNEKKAKKKWYLAFFWDAQSLRM